MAEADCELQTMHDQINRRTHILFGSLSSGMSNKMKQVEWQKIAETVNTCVRMVYKFVYLSAFMLRSV